MKHHDFSSFAFAERVEKAESVGAETTNFVEAETTSLASSESEPGARLRSALRLAQDRRAAQRARRDRVKEALERANEMSAALEGKLAEFSNLDVEIGESCAVLILRAIDNAEEPMLELSPELQRKTDQKFALEKSLSAARRAADRFRQELTAAERDLGEADAAVASAAIDVAAFEVEPIASELAEVEQRAAVLRRLLLGYSAQRHAGGFLPMSRAAAQLLRGVRGAHDPTIAALWSGYLAKLSVDCTATFDRGSFS